MIKGKQEKVTLRPYNLRIMKGFKKVHKSKSKSAVIDEIFGYGVKTMHETQKQIYLDAADDDKSSP